MPYIAVRFMKRLLFSVLSLTVAVGLTACDKSKTKVRQTKPNTGPKVTENRSVESTPRDDGDMEVVEKKKKDEVVDPVVKANKIPPPPTQNPEYAAKAEGKPGYVQSPYDSQHRLIDVRGLPPGTEAECPYTRRTFLVPP